MLSKISGSTILTMGKKYGQSLTSFKNSLKELFIFFQNYLPMTMQNVFEQ